MCISEIIPHRLRHWECSWTHWGWEGSSWKYWKHRISCPSCFCDCAHVAWKTSLWEQHTCVADFHDYCIVIWFLCHKMGSAGLHLCGEVYRIETSVRKSWSWEFWKVNNSKQYFSFSEENEHLWGISLWNFSICIFFLLKPSVYTFVQHRMWFLLVKSFFSQGVTCNSS